jgi:hypothetical protein
LFGPTAFGVAFLLRDASVDEQVHGLGEIGPATLDKARCANGPSSLVTAIDNDQAFESRWIAQYGLQGDTGARRLRSQNARRDRQRIENLEKILDENFECDRRCMIDGGAGAAVVVGDRAPRAVENFERLRPEFAAADLAAMGDERRRPFAEGNHE